MQRRSFIPADEVKELAASFPNLFAFAESLLPMAQSYAVAPVSKFYVGAVGIGVSGAIYLGGNHEFPQAAICFTVHAEQCLYANARMHGENALSALFVTAAPCGHCRQFLAEFHPLDSFPVTITGKPTMVLGQLLPLGFTGKDFLPESGTPKTCCTTPATDRVHAAAIEAAKLSHCPYTENNSGVALVYADNTIFTGQYLENAAFNPSMNPLVVALMMAHLAGKAEPPVRCVLVESGDRFPNQGAARLLLQTIAPAAHLEIFRL
ncbi:cytidine deaminase [Pelomyxa schiedti]|nr:cytidine deaminase [Pelomyxa schiedti]